MTSPAAPAGAPIGHAEIRTILIGVVLAMLLGALDQTIVVTALPTIGRDLGNAESLSWVVTAYLVTSTSVTPLYGKLSDIHGRRVTLMAAISIFLVGSVACAVRTSDGTVAEVRGSRQGSAVTLGNRSTVGTFTSAEGRVEVACAHQRSGSARTVLVVPGGPEAAGLAIAAMVLGVFAAVGGTILLGALRRSR